MTPEQNKLMEQCRAEAPYTVLKLSDRYTPTYVIQGGPVHIAAFWVTEREAQSECDLLNAVHAQALFDERSKATKVLTDEIDASIRIIRDGYCASTYQSYGVLRYQCCGGDADNREHKYHCQAKAVLKRLEDVRDNGYLAPAAGLTVEEVERANNVKDQCIATAWDGLSGKILVDGGSGTMRELLCDAHDVIRFLLNKQ